MQLSISSGEELMKFLSRDGRMSSRVKVGGGWGVGDAKISRVPSAGFFFLGDGVKSSAVREKRVGFMCSSTIAGNCDSVRHPG